MDRRINRTDRDCKLGGGRRGFGFTLVGVGGMGAVARVTGRRGGKVRAVLKKVGSLAMGTGRGVFAVGGQVVVVHEAAVGLRRGFG